MLLFTIHCSAWGMDKSIFKYICFGIAYQMLFGSAMQIAGSLDFVSWQSFIVYSFV